MSRLTTLTRLAAGAWTPHNIPGLAFRVVADQANGGGAADTNPVLWLPDEVRGNHVRAVTGNPLYRTNIANGRGALRFSSDRMQALKALPGNITFVYAVCTFTGTLPFVGSRSIFTRNSASPADPGINGLNGTQNIQSFGNCWINGVGGAANQTWATPAVPTILMTEDTTPSHTWVGGVSLGSWGTGANYWDGDLLEAGAVCTTAVSSADRALLLSYLADRYGISV